MANQIQTQEFAETIAANIKREIPILEYIETKELSDRLVGGSGDIVSVLVPDYGRVSKGASFMDGGTANATQLSQIEDLKVQVDRVPVKVEIKKVGAGFDVLDKTLKLFTQNSQINEPRISHLCRFINGEVFRCVLSASHSSIVGNIDFAALAEAVAYVDESLVGDNTAGMLSPLLNNSIAASGAAKFANASLAGPSGTKLNLYKGVLGEWMNATFFKSADAGSIKLGNNAANAFAMTGSVANVSDGAETLSLSGISFGGGNVLTKIPAGTPFIIGSGTPGGPASSPFTVSDVKRRDTQITRTFVALPNPATEDGSWPITSGGSPAAYSATIGIAKVNLNSVVGGALTKSAAAVPNTFYTASAAQSGLQFFCPLLAGAKYALGAVFAGKAIAFASAVPRPLAVGDSQATVLDGELNVRTTLGSDTAQGMDVWRVECMTGQTALYGAGAVAIYGQIV